MRAIPKGKRLVLVGDPDQLPPVGPGSPFSDMLRSGALPAVRLTEIFRQAQQSLIVMNAHRINRGEMPDLRVNRKRDFFFMRCPNEEETVQLIRDLCTRRLPQNMSIPPEQIQVLSPTRKGGVGTVALNKMLQSALNPSGPDKREHKYGNYCFREGDRVMQIRNNYDIVWKKTDGSAAGTGIFNGDVGLVREIDRDKESMKVVFDDREAEYDFAQLGELEPAFAVTVHKSQGSEYKAVVIVADRSQYIMLQKQLFYTAVTRAKNLCCVVGSKEAVIIMTTTKPKDTRHSMLDKRIIETYQSMMENKKEREKRQWQKLGNVA